MFWVLAGLFFCLVAAPAAQYPRRAIDMTVLFGGYADAYNGETWEFVISIESGAEFRWSWDELMALPQETAPSTFLTPRTEIPARRARAVRYSAPNRQTLPPAASTFQEGTNTA